MTNGSRTCATLNDATRYEADRVGIISEEKPNCACEHECFASCSPGLISHEEVIVRLVCEPMHVHPKRLEVKTSFFSHVFTRGASVQRFGYSTCKHFVNCAKTLVEGDLNRAWLGYVFADAKSIREIVFEDKSQAYSVLDAALEDNIAHAEIHASRRVAPEDQIEHRKNLRDLFLKSGFHGRKKLLDQEVWNEFPEKLKERKVPDAWKDAVD